MDKLGWFEDQHLELLVPWLEVGLRTNTWTSQSPGWRVTEPRTGTSLKEADTSPTDIQHEAPNEIEGATKVLLSSFEFNLNCHAWVDIQLYLFSTRILRLVVDFITYYSFPTDLKVSD